MNLKILTVINDYANQSPVRLHMPGHKANVEFCRLFGGANSDITELSCVKNEAAVKEAEKDVAKILGAKKSFLLSDGASMAIFAMLYSVRALGKKIIIERTAHKSVYNALALFGIEPIIIGESDGIGLPPIITATEIVDMLKDDPEVSCALLTYPDYYGRTFDIAEVYGVLKSNGKKLLIDDAHGVHYAFISDYIYAGRYADAWVDSAHKVLCSLNQGAILSVNDPSLIEGAAEGVNVFSTSSPSYPILASVEYGVKKADGERERYNKFRSGINSLKKELVGLGFSVTPNTDCFKLSVEFGKNANSAQSFFERDGIFVEMNDGERLLFMFSAENTEEDLRRLTAAFEKCKLRNVPPNRVVYKKGEKVVNYSDAIKAPSELVELKNCAGRIAAVNAGVFPPCYPIVVAGERITSDAAEILRTAESVFGAVDGKIKVIREVSL